jgi:hypothetical protein
MGHMTGGCNPYFAVRRIKASYPHQLTAGALLVAEKRRNQRAPTLMLKRCEPLPLSVGKELLETDEA